MSERRHAPSAARLRKAAQKGQVPFSPDLAHGLALLGGLAALGFLAAPALRALLQLAASQWGRAGARLDQVVMARQPLANVATSMIPLLGAALFATWLASTTQRGFRWVAPQWGWRQSLPSTNVQRLKSQADTAIVGWLKGLILLAIAAHLLWQEAPALASLGAALAGGGANDAAWRLTLEGASILGRLAMALAFTMVAFGLLDYLWQRRRHRLQLRMTDEELREEQRQS